MNDTDHVKLEDDEQALKVDNVIFSGTSTNSRVMLKAKRRVVVSSHPILSPFFNCALSIPTQCKSSPVDGKEDKDIQVKIEIGKTIREAVLTQAQQFIPKNIWPLVPPALDHFRLNDRNISKKTERRIYTDLVYLATDLQNQFYSYDPDTSISILGLPKAVWNKVFPYLEVQELKSFRSTGPDANSLVESSLPWAVNVCFIHDEKVHPRQGQYPEIPIEMTCTDDSVGWPNVRIRNFKSPFPAKKYFLVDNQHKLHGRQFLKIKVLEIHDSSLHWTDLLEAISCLPELREFNYTHTKEYLHHNNVLKVLKGDLNDHSEIAKAIKNQTKYKKLRSSKSSSSKTLQNVKLQGLNLEITNFVLSLLNQFCRDLKELDLIFWEGLFLHASTPAIQPHRSAPSSAPLVEVTFPGLEAWKLINNNQESLNALRISFLDEKQHRRIGPGFTQNPKITEIPIVPILMPALSPQHEKLKLIELILEFPPTVGVEGSRMKFPNKTEQEISESDDQFMSFCFSQVSQIGHLDYFNLKTVIDDSCRIESSIMQSDFSPNQLRTILDKDKIVIGKCMTCREEPVEWDRMVGYHQQNVTYEFNLYLNDSSISYEKIFDKEMHMVPNCYLLQIITQKSIPLRDFNINRLLLKFPNLKRLALVNTYFRGTPIHKYEDFPKITNSNIQTIINSLSSLKELILQCNMSEVTDFGLAGITATASNRMNKQGQYNILPQDRLGQPISRMKHLQVLELNGLGNRVTGVTAYLAFEQCALEELYLCSPKFTKRQKKDLKDRFAQKKNFKMVIM